jgi:tetratricopeptide (TPR) repeat protein
VRPRTLPLLSGFLALGVWIGTAAGVAAPQDELASSYARFTQLMQAGNYAEAEAIAKRMTELVARQLGRLHPSYAATLADLAYVYDAEGHYGDAEALYRQALAIEEKTIGPEDPRVSNTLENLGDTYLREGRYPEAKAALERAFAIKQKVLGPDNPALATTLNSIATEENVEGHFDNAAALYQRVIAMLEKVVGPDHPNVASALTNLGTVYDAEGRFADAENSYMRALGIREKALGPDHPDLAVSFRNLGHLYDETGRYSGAEQSYRRAIGILEKRLGPEHPSLAPVLNALGALYGNEARYQDAEALFKRALAIEEHALGPWHTDLALMLDNLATNYDEEGRYAEAEPLLRRALAIQEKALGPDHPNLAPSLESLGICYQRQGRFDDAIAQYRRALAIEKKALGPEHPDFARTLSSLAGLLGLQGDTTEAQDLYQEALRLREKTFGPDHLATATTLSQLAFFHAHGGNAEQALAEYRRAAAIMVKTGGGLGAAAGSGASDLPQDRLGIFAGLVWSAATLAADRPEQATSLGAEAFVAAQRAEQNTTAAALSQMAARFAKGDTSFAKLVRQEEDLAAQVRALDKALVAGLPLSTTSGSSVDIEAVRKQLDETERQRAEVERNLTEQFPQFVELASPDPLTLDEAQKLLAGDEALLAYLVTNQQTYIFALTREGFDWKQSDLGAKDLEAKIAKLREALDIRKIQKRLADGKKPEEVLFDVGLANELYAALVAPVESTIKDKKHLLVVPAGALTSLPFHLLVTEKREKPATQPADYRDVAWLVKREAVTTLPSVASLKALRVLAKEGSGEKPLTGYGDPVFRGEAAVAEATGETVARAEQTRAYTGYYRGSEADLDVLRNGLPQLPETAKELRSVAERLGVPESEIHLGQAATEAAVKQASLDQYRIVYFATHGLVAGEIKTLAEPALALTLPQEATEQDDGLLTASEIAQLKLNADFVVLSACNTAAGDKPGAEALSGLARAFFYAGACAPRLALARGIKGCCATHHRDLRRPQVRSKHWQIGSSTARHGRDDG